MISLKLLLEGVPVPITGIVRSQTENNQAVADISIYPGEYVTGIYLGTNVIVFFRMGEDEEWRLFFDGRVVAKPKYVRTLKGESVTLSCIQHIDVLRYAKVSPISLALTQASGISGISPSGADKDYMEKLKISSIIFSSLAGNLSETFFGKNGIIKNITKIQPLNKRYIDSINLYGRLDCIDNPPMHNLYKKNLALQMLVFGFDSIGQSAGLFGVMSYIASNMLYKLCAIGSPYYNVADNRLYQFIYVPELPYSAPIKSNVIFDPVSIVSEPESAYKPTRLCILSMPSIFTGPGAITPVLNANYYLYPPELNEKLLRCKNDRFISRTCTDEEMIEERLVLDKIDPPFVDLFYGLGEADKARLAKAFGAAAYYIKSNINDSTTVSIEFDPYLINGLSALVIVPNCTYICGKLISIVDEIDINKNTATTQATLINTVSAGWAKELVDICRQRFPATLFKDPCIYHDRFRDENITKVYSKFFGSGSVVDNTFENGISKLSAEYKKISDPYARASFVRKTKYREIVNDDNYMKFIKATMRSDKDYYNTSYNKNSNSTSGPFMEDRQDTVLKYVNKMINDKYVKSI